MRNSVLVLIMLAWSIPAFAQFGQLDRLRRARERAEEKVEKVDQQVGEFQISESEEQQLGAMVSERIRQRYGVVQDADVHRYVALVGTLLAQASARPALPWQFIVLDTDAVNAFAAPGGFVHITRGALALVETEAELAGVLAHEITHIVSKHTVEAIRKNKMVQLGAGQTLADRGLFLDQLARASYEMVVENSFDRTDELDADRGGLLMANQVGYAPDGLSAFLARLAERNRGATERRGLFASHPQTQERQEQIQRRITEEGLAATARLPERYQQHLAFERVSPAEIATIDPGSAGVAGKASPQAPETKRDEDTAQQPQAQESRRRGFGLDRLTAPLGTERQNPQLLASGGARGVDPDRDASGGPNPAPVPVTITAADLTAFKEAIAAVA